MTIVSHTRHKPHIRSVRFLFATIATLFWVLLLLLLAGGGFVDSTVLHFVRSSDASTLAGWPAVFAPLFRYYPPLQTDLRLPLRAHWVAGLLTRPGIPFIIIL